MNDLRPRKRNRDTATAATKAITSAAHPTTSSVTIRLLRTASQKKSRPKALR